MCRIQQFLAVDFHTFGARLIEVIERWWIVMLRMVGVGSDVANF